MKKTCKHCKYKAGMFNCLKFAGLDRKVELRKIQKGRLEQCLSFESNTTTPKKESE